MYTNPTTEEQSTVRDVQKKINALHLNYIHTARKENVAIKNNNVLVDNVVDNVPISSVSGRKERDVI